MSEICDTSLKVYSLSDRIFGVYNPRCCKINQQMSSAFSWCLVHWVSATLKFDMLQMRSSCTVAACLWCWMLRQRDSESADFLDGLQSHVGLCCLHPPHGSPFTSATSNVYFVYSGSLASHWFSQLKVFHGLLWPNSWLNDTINPKLLKPAFCKHTAEVWDKTTNNDVTVMFVLLSKLNCVYLEDRSMLYQE